MVDNRRVKITKLMLQEALIDLLQEKALENISVRELVNKADINRSTFYSHYDTIYDLLYSITEKYMKRIIFQNKIHDSSLTEHIELLRFMKSNRKAYLALIRTGQFFDYLIDKSLLIFDSNEMSFRMLKKEYKSAYETMVQYSCAGTVQTIRLFLEDKLELTTAQVATLLYDTQEATYHVLLDFQNEKIKRLKIT